jgi:regulator of protease activity HflC (stomatin/prohibitin superfamily)
MVEFSSSDGPSRGSSKKSKMFFDSYGDPKWGVIGTIGGIIAALVIILIMCVSEFFAIVPPAHKGLVVKGGQLQENTLSDGFYMKTPFWTTIETMPTSMQTTNEDSPYVENFINIEPLSKDGQVMNVDIQINYQVVDPYKFRMAVGSADPRDIEPILFVPTTRRLIYDYTSEYTWKNLIQKGDRQELGKRIFDTMSTGQVTKRECTLESIVVDETTGLETIVEAGCRTVETEIISSPIDFGVIITAVNLRKVAPNDEIIASVEAAMKKEQDVKIAEQESKEAEALANKAIETKRGETESRKLEVAAEAYKQQVEMEANAEGMKAEAEGKLALAEAERALALALQSSDGLIEYKRLDIEMVMAEAQLEFAKHYAGAVPETVTIIGDEAARNGRMIYGLPGVSVMAGETN